MYSYMHTYIHTFLLDTSCGRAQDWQPGDRCLPVLRAAVTSQDEQAQEALVINNLKRGAEE